MDKVIHVELTSRNMIRKIVWWVV